MIRDYKESDEKGITSLFREVFGKEMTLEQWKWKYAVPGEGRIHSKVAEDKSPEIIGHAGAIPLRGLYRNKPIQVFQIVDVMVHPKARGFFGKKNLFDRMIKELFEDLRKEFSHVFCYGFPGKRPYILGERIKVYDKIEQGIDCCKSLTPSFSLNPYTIKPLSWDDGRVDTLWMHVSKEIDLAIMRDRQYLQWRYTTNPLFSYELLGCFLFGNLKGWLVMRHSGDEVFVVDLLTKPKRYMSMLKALESYLIFRGKKEIHFWLPERWRKRIKGYSMKETQVVVTNMIWKLPIKTSTARESLYYTMGDADIY
jgi:hypothetical protein